MVAECIRDFNRIGSALAVLDFLNIGSALALRSFGRLGSGMSVLDFVHVGSSISLHGSARQDALRWYKNVFNALSHICIRPGLGCIDLVRYERLVGQRLRISAELSSVVRKMSIDVLM